MKKTHPIPIRRIAAFEVDKNREEIASLENDLHEAEKNLKHIKQYTIKYIEGLLAKYGDMFPRRTEIRLEPFAKIDKSVAALTNIRVGWDKKNCYIGTSVKSDDYVLCNEFDHLLCVERSGDFKVIGIPDKIFIDRLFEFRRYDKNTVFGVVYSEKKTGRAFFKRTRIASFIKDREYRIAPEGCRLELITPRPNAIYEIKVDTPIRAKQIQQISLMDAPERSPKAGGILISPRKLLKITFVRLLDESDAVPEPELVELPPENNGGNGGNGSADGGSEDGTTAGNAPAPETTPAPAPETKSESLSEKPVQPQAPRANKPVSDGKNSAARSLPKKDAEPTSPAPAEIKKTPEPKATAKPVSSGKAAPVAEKPAPVAKPLPAAEKPAPVAKLVPVAEKPAPVAKPVPVAEKPAPVAKPVPAAEKPAPVAKPLPAEEKPAPVAKPVPVAEKPAPVAKSAPVATPAAQPEEKPQAGSSTVPTPTQNTASAPTPAPLP